MCWPTPSQHWYGRYDPATQTARANLPEHPSVDLTGSWFAPKDPVDIVVIFDADYLQAGHPRHVVVTAAVPHRSDKPGRPGDDSFHCLTCRPVIGMAVFTRRLNTWLLEDENDAVDLAGEQWPATLHQAGHAWGQTCTAFGWRATPQADDFAGSSISLLVPWQEDVVRAFTGETGYSNRDACGPETPLRDPCYAWQRADTSSPFPARTTTIWCSPAVALSLRRISIRRRRRKPAKLTQGHGRPKPEPSAVPTAIPYTSVERLRFRDGRYIPAPGHGHDYPGSLSRFQGVGGLR